ncbi:helix-turn-helix domain-containing protein [Bacillus paralicheniformis]|uniref:helix-turn-helix domain-containing protein n=1 Tax=Bacillus paralicheniformis TaxID=1648923 RepID=UPI002244A432|nr:helix-turn-helix domain-containing protein [Bacillus paralicheniformis]MEC1023530.1 helix-turn-helix domain-containing protein [Bacillus paralicheniformis]MEC1028013.1 helix-turn-helix domain-containing protein [Bacillus paralicheniformis]MEC1034362.1 helix-turn-helix domain-containing protein [Bacillus paralicheniformis]MEC1050256.1 helix-turn-helix domain-containing protein [Bacillus paralicheniformis]MEC1059807.1 helix-turn-helix domain-containing protein [Bacillus paralicheniformis]
MYTKESAKMASFRSLDELNDAIRTHIYRNKAALTPAAIEVLKVLSRHACKTPGVAYLKLQSIADLIGRHRVTVIRAIKRLVDCGIIRKEAKFRPISGGNGANMYVILPADNNDATPQMQLRSTSDKSTEETAEAPKSSGEAVIPKSVNKLLRNTYSAFKSLVDSFVNDRKLTNRLYGIYLAHTRYLKGVYDSEILEEIGLYAVRQTFIATKRKYIRNLTGYYNGVLDRMLDRLYETRFDSLIEG